MLLTAKNLEIRGRERKKRKKLDKDGNASEYLIVRVEDETGRVYELLDNDVDNEQYYKRGAVADFTLDMKQWGISWNVSVADFKLHKDD